MPKVVKLPRSPGRPAGDVDLKPEIIRAAEVAFAEYGFDAASLRQIAMAAGVSPANVLHHYGSKRKLYAQVLTRISRSLESIPALTALDGPGAETLDRVIGALMDWIVANGLYARIILREIMDNDERVQAAKHWPMRQGMRVVYRAFQDAIGAAPGDRISELLSLQVLGASFLFFTGQPTHRSQSLVDHDGWEEDFRTLVLRTARCALNGEPPAPPAST